MSELVDMMGQTESAVKAKFNFLVRDGYVEHVPHKTYYWRVPERMKNAELRITHTNR